MQTNDKIRKKTEPEISDGINPDFQKNWKHPELVNKGIYKIFTYGWGKELTIALLTNFIRIVK